MRKVIVFIVCITFIFNGIDVLLAYGENNVFGKEPTLLTSYDTGEDEEIEAVGSYSNWDGISNYAQFRGPDGNFYYAIDTNDAVVVKKTKGSASTGQEVVLRKKHPKFGTALCDSEGNYYLVTGEDNETDDTDVETVFVSKYDKNGKHLQTTGDNGSSSLAEYYHDGFYTKEPFEAGNCDAAISNGVLTVNYSRLMYSGHQSNSVFSVDINSMKKVNMGDFYQSHSFAQRVVPTVEGFVYMSEGDCFNRTFQIYSVKNADNYLSYHNEEGIFDFWVEDGAYDAYDMYVVNNNFAHMGGMATLSNGNIVFASQSARSLNSNAEQESEDVFVQIFNPYKKLNNSNSYVTVGIRSGLAGNNGRTSVKNYGVKWLTDDGRIDQDEKVNTVSNVQIVTTDKDEIVVLYQREEGKYYFYDYEGETYSYFDSDYKGVYYTVLDKNGNILYPETLLSNKAMLNPCRMPVYSDEKIHWMGNEYDDYDYNVYLYSMSTNFVNGEEETESNSEVVTIPQDNSSLPTTTKNMDIDTITVNQSETHSSNMTTKETDKVESTTKNNRKEDYSNNSPTFTSKKSAKKTYGSNRIVKLSLKVKNQKVKYKKLKKKKVVLKKAIKATLGNYKLHYFKEGGSSRLKVNSKGHIIVKKGTKKGTYKIIVNIWSFNVYGSCDKNVRVKVKVK